MRNLFFIGIVLLLISAPPLALRGREMAVGREVQRHYSGGFIGINAMNLEITKTDVLAQIGSSDYAPELVVNEVQRVRVFGDGAVVLAKGTARWVKRDGRWQAVAAHASPMPTKA